MPTFDGSLLINQRTVTTVVGHFKRRRLGDAARQPLGTDDLLDLLYLIDLYVACPKIRIDGSLPPRDIDSLREEIAFLKKFGVDESCFVFTPPNADEITHCSLSALQATKSLEDFLPDQRVDQSLPSADATTIRHKLEIISEQLKEVRLSSNAAERAIEIGGEIGRERFRGSKAVAGFTSLGFDSLDRILRFIESHNDCGFACSALINRFRFFYLRQLAFDVGAVYSPADRWEAISNQHHLHFLNFIKTKMGQKFSVEGGKDLLFPPIALYAMLTMDGASDRPLLERVAELRQEFSGLRGYFAKQTRGALETLVPDAVLASTNPKIDENIIREVSDFFDKRYLEAEFARQYGEMKRGVPSKIVRYTVPVALSLTVAGVAFAAGNWIGAAGGAVVAGVWPVATDFFKEITKDIAADKLGALGSAGIDQYRRLHFRLLQMPGVASRLQQIVQREFGCEIVLSPNNRD